MAKNKNKTLFFVKHFENWNSLKSGISEDSKNDDEKETSRKKMQKLYIHNFICPS
jgi:hypothetical protein